MHGAAGVEEVVGEVLGLVLEPVGGIAGELELDVVGLPVVLDDVPDAACLTDGWTKSHGYPVKQYRDSQLTYG